MPRHHADQRPNNVNTLFPVTVREIANAGVRDTTENSLFINGHDATNVRTNQRLPFARVTPLLSNGLLLLTKNDRRSFPVTTFGSSKRPTRSPGSCQSMLPNVLPAVPLCASWCTSYLFHVIHVYACISGPPQINLRCCFSVPRVSTPGVYVRVHGHVRLQNNKRYVIAHAVRPVTDFNEVTFHFLDAIFVYLHTRKTQGGGVDGTEASPHQPPQRPQQPAYNQYVPPPAPAAAGAAGGMGGGGGAFGGAGGRGVELRDRIMQFYESPQNASVQQGIHHQQVAQSMPDVSPQEIRSTVEFLDLRGSW
ncbi:unnamed protein product [Closterium sp. NIES-54]